VKLSELVRAEKLPGGKADGRPDSDFDPKQLAMGIEVEQEHTPDLELAKEIAKDHLSELPDYYSRLKVMEEEGEQAKKGRQGGVLANLRKQAATGSTKK